MARPKAHPDGTLAKLIAQTVNDAIHGRLTEDDETLEVLVGNAFAAALLRKQLRAEGGHHMDNHVAEGMIRELGSQLVLASGERVQAADVLLAEVREIATMRKSGDPSWKERREEFMRKLQNDLDLPTSNSVLFRKDK